MDSYMIHLEEINSVLEKMWLIILDIDSQLIVR
jgi:hypothetical protein